MRDPLSYPRNHLVAPRHEDVRATVCGVIPFLHNLGVCLYNRLATAALHRTLALARANWTRSRTARTVRALSLPLVMLHVFALPQEDLATGDQEAEDGSILLDPRLLQQSSVPASCTRRWGKWRNQHTRSSQPFRELPHSPRPCSGGAPYTCTSTAPFDSFEFRPSCLRRDVDSFITYVFQLRVPLKQRRSAIEKR